MATTNRFLNGCDDGVSRLYDNPLYSDCSIHIADNTVFHGHKSILCSRSEVFAAALERFMGGKPGFNLNEEPPDAVRAMLLFLYDRIEFLDEFQQSWNTASGLIANTYKVADLFLVTGLKRWIIRYINFLDVSSINPDAWEHLVRTVYSPGFPWISPEDRLLREVLVYKTASSNLLHSHVTDCLTETLPEFAKDLARRLAKDVSQSRSLVVFPPPETNWDAIPLF